MKKLTFFLFQATGLFRILFALPAMAQVAQSATAATNNKKLPDVQETGLRAPEKIKIDGKTTEWDDAFQAYNKTTQVFYTVSNDDANLYLTLQATNSQIVSKIMNGGVTFTISTSGKKKDKDAVAITFPLTTAGNMRDMMSSMRPAFEKMQNMDPAQRQKMTDSIAYASNRERIDKLKDIKVVGIKDIPDSILSIYNEEGIKARALFDTKGAYNYELAVPMKYLGISANDAKEFTYNVKLNGLMAMMGGMMGAMPAGAVDRVMVNGGGGGGGGTVSFGGGGGGMSGGGGGMMMSRGGGAGGIDIMAMISPTDFWGKYTPAKK